jgi:hypothetical protein
MSYSATVYKAFIASPGDVMVERGVIRDVLGEWNVVNADHRKQVLLPVGWETHSTPEMGDRPQAIINKQILSGCDLLVGVFWTRIGTATGDYQSGTVEEIEEHIKAGKPAMLYFSSAPVMPDSVDPEQYRRLKEFRSSCQSRGLYESYTDVQDFRNKFYRQLQLKINGDQYFSVPDASAVTEIRPSFVPVEPTLTKEATFLLKEAAADPRGQVLFIGYDSGYALQVNGRNLIEEGSERSVAIWKSALKELESQGMLESVSHKRTIFMLTRKGYEAADRLP